jgi:23S rRNA pseudouridine2605 synthase
MPLVRLNKYLADRGVASRRRCDELIASGSVLVDGHPAVELGTKIDPDTARVEVDGRVFAPDQRERQRYYLLNKPKRVVCTNDRREERKRAIDLVTDPDKGRIYTVGRLDEDSTGLILLTNDGDFANLIAHPRNEVPKTYLVKVRGRIDAEAIDKLKRGVYLAEGRTSGVKVRILKRTEGFTNMSVTLAEGKNREVRRIFAKVGFAVLALRRTRIGNLRDQRLKEGQWRPLLRAEVADLLAVAHGEREVVDEPPARSRRPRGGPPAGRAKAGQRPARALRGKPSPDPRGRDGKGRVGRKPKAPGKRRAEGR